MSKYSERHPHEAPCAVTTCEEPGTEILAVHGQLGWFCALHKESLRVNVGRSK